MKCSVLIKLRTGIWCLKMHKAAILSIKYRTGSNFLIAKAKTDWLLRACLLLFGTCLICKFKESETGINEKSPERMYSGLKLEEWICLGLIINSNDLHFLNLNFNFLPTKKIIGVKPVLVSIRLRFVQSNPYCRKLVYWLMFVLPFHVQWKINFRTYRFYPCLRYPTKPLLCRSDGQTVPLKTASCRIKWQQEKA